MIENTGKIEKLFYKSKIFTKIEKNNCYNVVRNVTVETIFKDRCQSAYEFGKDGKDGISSGNLGIFAERPRKEREGFGSAGFG